MKLLERLKSEIAKKRPQMKMERVLFHQDNAPCHKSFATMEELRELHFEFLPHPPYSPDRAPSDYYLFKHLKQELCGNKFGSNEEVIAETESYFEGLDGSYYKRSIEMLKKRCTDCITLKGDYLDEYSRILPKKCVFLSNGTNFSTDVVYVCMI